MWNLIRGRQGLPSNHPILGRLDTQVYQVLWRPMAYKYAISPIHMHLYLSITTNLKFALVLFITILIPYTILPYKRVLSTFQLVLSFKILIETSCHFDSCVQLTSMLFSIFLHLCRSYHSFVISYFCPTLQMLRHSLRKIWNMRRLIRLLADCHHTSS